LPINCDFEKNALHLPVKTRVNEHIKSLVMLNINKSPKASLENKKFTFFLMGFIIALSAIYIGFEWKAKEIVVIEMASTDHLFEDDMDIVQTAEPPPPPPPPPPAEVIIEILTIVEDDVEVEAIDFSQLDDETPIVIQAPIAAPVIEEEPEDVIFQVVERMPEFPGGQQALMRFLNDNIRYPVIAQENNIQGRVVLQFVVNADGSIVDIQVVRGVDPSLDREAVRVVNAMPRWSPGQQRGQNVRVMFTLPVNFRLQ